MLKHRIIPVLLYKETGLVKGKKFNSWRRIGPAIPAVKVYDMRGIDELVFLDIGDGPDFDLISHVSDECFMPLAVGGGVRTIEHFQRLLAAGADKVVVNTAAVRDPSLIEQAARKFGSQCVTVSIDVKDGRVVIQCGEEPTDLDPADWAQQVERLGAGEILLNSVERDGTMQGYDLRLVREISNSVSIPVIACGGAGTYEDMGRALGAGAHAVAASAIFQFTEQTPKGAAEYLERQGFAIRSDNRRHGELGSSSGAAPT